MSQDEPRMNSTDSSNSKNDTSDAKCDDEWEVVDELLVHVEVPAIVQCTSSVDGQQINTKFIGLDTDRPIVQIGPQVFSGQYEDTIGTSVFFKTRDVPEDPNKADSIEIQLPKQVEYLCKADKKLVLSRVFLNEKDTNREPDVEEMHLAD